MPMNPTYIRPCCEGLVHKLSTSSRIGDGGTCEKANDSSNCIGEGAPLFVYPVSPSCCRGLSPRRPSAVSPIGFADVCMRGGPAVQVNNSEARKELSVDQDLGLRDDPGVSNE